MTRSADESKLVSWFTPKIVPCRSDVGHYVTEGAAFWRTGRVALTTAENDGTAHAGSTASTRIVTPGVPDW